MPRRRIIILDDETEIIKLLENELSADFEIIHFEETLSLLAFMDTDEHFSRDTFLLVDIVLGEDEEGGFNAVSSLTEAGIFLPVIFVSNSNLDADIQRAAEVGSSAFVNKLRLNSKPGDIRQALAQAEGAYLHRVREKIGRLNEWGNRAIVMVGSLEHEFGNLTMPIINSALAIKLRCGAPDKFQAEEIRKSAELILSAVADASKLLNHIFSFVRGEREGLSLANVDIVALTKRVATRSIEEGTNELRFISNSDSYHCLVDEMKYIQILVNMLANATKYGTPGGKIDVCLSLDEGQLDLSIRDYGPVTLGRREVKRLWQPLERGNNVAPESGGGLGLTIVKQFSEMMGGKAYHDTPSDDLGGNVFGVMLPVQLPQYEVEGPDRRDGS